MNEPLRHDPQPRATRNLPTQKGSMLPPRKAPRSQVLPQASPFAVSPTASRKSSRAQLRPHLLQGISGPLAQLTSSLHPHIHVLPTAPASQARGLGWGVPARAFLKKPG